MTDFVLPVLGPLAWIDVVLLGWFALTAASVAYVTWDTFVRGNPDFAVMKWGWVLVTLYMGPIAAALYVFSDKEPHPGTHAAFIRPLWKQAVGSTIHCVAGDATGIILAATVTALLGLPMWIDLATEYAAGFIFGLLIFQALFMKDMMGGSYLGAVKMSFLPEWLSMNAMMAGMFPVMVVLMMGRDMRAMEPTQLLYWATMSVGIIVGFFVALPVNAWLVANGLKHGMGSTQPAEPTDVNEPTTIAHQEGAAA
jgi:manganese oxidase